MGGLPPARRQRRWREKRPTVHPRRSFQPDAEVAMQWTARATAQAPAARVVGVATPWRVVAPSVTHGSGLPRYDPVWDCCTYLHYPSWGGEESRAGAAPADLTHPSHPDRRARALVERFLFPFQPMHGLLDRSLKNVACTVPTQLADA